MVFAGIGVIAVAKFFLAKYLFMDQPAYEKCLAGSSTSSTLSSQIISACGSDPVIGLVIGWIILGVGATILILGLRADSIPKSRYA